MFQLIRAAPLSVTLGPEPRFADGRLVRGEHGLFLETSGAAVSVRRRFSHEIIVPRASRFLLEDGDVLWGPTGGLGVRLAPEHRDDASERRSVEAWQHPASFAVLADQLLDLGDPLGERIAASLGRRASAPLGPHGWVGAEWRHGLLRRVSMSRPEWPGVVPWRQALLELLVSREARFLEELTIDLPRLEPDADLLALAHEVLELPWPRWLTRLQLGVVARPLALEAPPAVRQHLTRLRGGSLFSWGARARLVIESAEDALAIEGLDDGAVDLHEAARIRVFPKKVRIERPTWPRYDSWPSWDFTFHDERWFLTWRHGAPRSDDIKVNGLDAFNVALLPGDRVEVLGALVLRFELA
ncbi:MAG: hypothetical protein INH41_04730 [Myxococcaceae bacterium]|nr:hypothetical protein [Myxococcaceae bacterium]